MNTRKDLNWSVLVDGKQLTSEPLTHAIEHVTLWELGTDCNVKDVSDLIIMAPELKRLAINYLNTLKKAKLGSLTKSEKADKSRIIELLEI